MMTRRPHSTSARLRRCAVLVALLTASCSRSGGSDGAAPTTAEFLASEISVSEGAAADIGIELRTALPIDEPLAVRVGTSAVGTADAGVDYVALPTRELVFPAGSAHGSVATVRLETLPDDLVEGEAETVELELFVADAQGRFEPAGTRSVRILDDDTAEVRFTVSASFASEGLAAPAGVEVELVLPPGKSLATVVSATATATRDGTATPGVDYVIPHPVAIFVPSGPTSVRLDVQLVDDDTFEGDETIWLELTDPTPGITLGPSRHRVTLVENDISFQPNLEVRLEPSRAVVAPGDVLGLHAGESVDLTIANAGLTSLALEPLTFTGDTRDFRVVMRAEGFEDEGGADAPAPGLAYDVRRASGETIRLELEPVPLPFARDAVVFLDGRPLTAPIEEWLGGLTIWKGRVAGAEETSAFLGMTGAGAKGWIDLPGERLHVVGGAEAGGPERAFTLPELGPPASGPVCAGALVAGAGSGVPSRPDAPPVTPAATQGYRPALCRLAIESDSELTQAFGSTTAAGEYVALLFAAVGHQFRAELQTDLEIAYLALYSASDPWVSPGPSGGIESLLFEFQDAWSNGGWPVAADLAHFLSGASLGGGIAYVGTLCNPDFGFGVSADLSGTIDWSAFEYAPSILNYDYAVVAHELGHGLGARHTHDYCPPLDRCAANCEAALECVDGTLMSYCHECFGGLGNIQLRFHAETANIMRGDVGASCLEPTRIDYEASVPFRIEFSPTSGAGEKRAVLDLVHDSPHLPSPFTIELEGRSN